MSRAFRSTSGGGGFGPSMDRLAHNGFRDRRMSLPGRRLGPYLRDQADPGEVRGSSLPDRLLTLTGTTTCSFGYREATCVGMAESATKGRPEGITISHCRRCASADGGRCRCQPAYQAQVFSRPGTEGRFTRASLPSPKRGLARRHDGRPKEGRTARPHAHDARRGLRRLAVGRRASCSRRATSSSTGRRRGGGGRRRPHGRAGSKRLGLARHRQPEGTG